MSLSMSRSAVSTGPRPRVAMPALVRRVDVCRPASRNVQARSNLPKSNEATETQVVQAEMPEQAGDKATKALGFIGALALSGAITITIASGIVPTSALAGPISYKTYNVTSFNIPPALIYTRFVQANSGCNPEVSRNAAGQVIDLKFVYVSCPPGLACNAYPYPTYNPLYEFQITTPKVSAATNPPPTFSNIWIRCFV